IFQKLLAEIEPVVQAEYEFIVKVFHLGIDGSNDSPTEPENPTEFTDGIRLSKPKNSPVADKKANDEVRRMMGEMFQNLEGELQTFIAYADKIDNFYSMYMLVRIGHEVMIVRDKETSLFLSVVLANSLVQVKRLFDKYIVDSPVKSTEFLPKTDYSGYGCCGTLGTDEIVFTWNLVTGRRNWSTTNTGKLSPSSSQNWGTHNSNINSNPGSANDWGKSHGATGSNSQGWGTSGQKPTNPNSNSNPTTPTVGQAWGGNQQVNAWGTPVTPTQTSTSGWGGNTGSSSTENSWAKTANKGNVQDPRQEETQPNKKSLDAIIEEAVNSNDGWGKTPVKQNTAWTKDKSPPAVNKESNTWETPAEHKNGTQAWGASKKANEDSGNAWGKTNSCDNGGTSSGAWGNAETGEWNSSNHWNSSSHDLTGTGVWAKNVNNNGNGSGNGNERNPGSGSIPVNASGPVNSGPNAGGNAWGNHNQQQSTNPNEERKVWRSNSSNTQPQQQQQPPVPDSTRHNSWAGSSSTNSNPTGWGSAAHTGNHNMDIASPSWGNPPINDTGSSAWGGSSTHSSVTTPTTPKTPSKITGPGWIGIDPHEVTADIKPTGWDEPSPPTARKQPQVDDGTSAWGNPSEVNAKATMQSNWTNPPSNQRNSTMQAQQPVMGSSTGQQPIRPTVQQNIMPQASQMKPDNGTSVWGGAAPNAHKVSSWGDPTPQTNHKVDDGTSAWKVAAPPRGSSGWGEPPSDTNWNNSGMNSKESMQDDPSIGHWGDEDRWEKGSQDSESSRGSGGWIKGANTKPPPSKDVNTAWMNKYLKQLMDMGFKRELAERVLKKNSMNMEGAVVRLKTMLNGTGGFAVKQDSMFGCTSPGSFISELLGLGQDANDPAKQGIDSLERHRKESVHSVHSLQQSSDGSTPSTPLNKELENLSLNDNQTQENKSFLPIGDNQQSISSSNALSPSSILPNHVQLNQQQLPFNKQGLNQGMISSNIANPSITGQVTQQQQLQQRLASLQQQQQQQAQLLQQQQQQQQQQQGLRNMVPQQQQMLQQQQQQQQQQLMMQQVHSLLRLAAQAGLIQPNMLHQQVTPQQVVMVNQLFQMHLNYTKLVQQQQLLQQTQNAAGGKPGMGGMLPQRQQELQHRITAIHQQIIQQQRQLNLQQQQMQQKQKLESTSSDGPSANALGINSSDVNQDLGPKESRLQQFFNKQSNKPSDIFGSQFGTDHHAAPSMHTSQSMPVLHDHWARDTSPGPLDNPDVGDSWPSSRPDINPTNLPNDLPPEFKPGVPWKYQTKDVENDPDATPGSVTQSILSIGLGPTLGTNNMNRSSSREDLVQRENEIRGLLIKPMQPPTSSPSISSAASPGAPTSWPTSSFPPTAAPPPPSNKKSAWNYPENYQQSYPPTSLTAALWNVPFKQTSAPTRPPPGLAPQPKPSWSTGGGSSGSGVSRSTSWDGGRSNFISGFPGSSNWGSGDNVQQDMPNNWLVLRNLTPQIDGSTLQTLCKQHGPLHTFHLNLSQGQALIQYGTRDEAAKAQKALHMCVLGNTTIMAEFSSSEMTRMLERNNQSSGWPQSMSGNKFSGTGGSSTNTGTNAGSSGTSSSSSSSSGGGGGGGGSGGSGGMSHWSGSTTGINLPSLPGNHLWSMQATPTPSSPWGGGNGDADHISSPTSMNYLPENLLGEGSV
ncbi:trinucleotide repeat-containing gene 6C protein-like, partial [Saccoglossus kowalevskii]